MLCISRVLRRSQGFSLGYELACVEPMYCPEYLSPRMSVASDEDFGSLGIPPAMFRGQQHCSWLLRNPLLADPGCWPVVALHVYYVDLMSSDDRFLVYDGNTVLADYIGIFSGQPFFVESSGVDLLLEVWTSSFLTVDGSGFDSLWSYTQRCDAAGTTPTTSLRS